MHPSSSHSSGSERRLAAIMFSDIVGYTATMAESEEKGLRARERHRDVLGPLVSRYGGEVVDENGDELVSTFQSAFDAVNCALAVQAELTAPTAVADRLQLRVGIHLGDVLFRDGHVYGDGVNVAARIRALAEPGAICVSDEVQHSVQNQANVETQTLGVHQLRNVPRPVPVFTVTGTAQPPDTRVAAAERPRTRADLRLLLGIGALALLAAVGAWWWSRPASDASAISSLAVLPLDDLSGDPTQAYFADGMTDALIAELAHIGSLRVISRTSVMQYKDARKPLPEIARELDVEAVVEGSVLRAGDRVRIVAQLIHAPTDRHLWSETYERDLEDVIELQRGLVQAIAGEIRIQLTPEEEDRLASAHVVEPEAYEAYLRGRHVWRQRTSDDLDRAVVQFQRAVELDPDSALGYLGLAASYDLQGWNEVIPPSEAISLASENIRRALELDESLAEAHVARGDLYWWTRDWDGIEREYRRALELNPGHAITHNWLGYYFAAVGRQEAALESIGLALELDPLSVSTRSDASLLYLFNRDYAQAAEYAREAVELGQGDAYWVLPTIYSMQGRHEDAVAVGRRGAEALEPRNAKATSRLIYSLARAGDSDEAARLLERLIKRSEREYIDPLNVAVAYVGLGEHDAFFLWAERAFEARSPWLNFLRVSPVYDDVRGDPRFGELVRRIGFPES